MNIIIHLAVFLYLICGIFGTKNIVMELNSLTIQDYIRNVPIGFLEFYSPECPHCQAVEPVYEQSSEMMKQSHQEISFARLNGDKFPDVMELLKISTIPTFIWINNRMNYSVLYTGDTEMPSNFLDFINEQILFDLTQISYDDFMRKEFPSRYNFTEGENVVVILVGNKISTDKEIKTVSNSLWNVGIKKIFLSDDQRFKSHFHLSSTTDASLMNVFAFKISKNSTINHSIYEVFNLTQDDFIERKNDNEMNFPHLSSKHLDNLMFLLSKNIISIFSHENEKTISSVPTLVFAHNYEINSTEYDQSIETLSEIARKYRMEIFFMIGNHKTKFTQIYVESFGLYINKFPVLCLTSPANSTVEKFRRAYSGRLPSTSEISEFIENWKSRKESVYISSEELPENLSNESYPIRKIIGSTFKSFINTPGKDILLVFCSDRIDVCTKFRERMLRVYRKLEKNTHLLFGEVNPYTNELNFDQFDFIPGIILFRDNGDQNKITKEFTGKLNTRDIIRFIRENAHHPVKSDESLPVEDILLREEATSELKPLNLNQKGIGRKLFEMLADPAQKELYKLPKKEEVKLESEYLALKLGEIFVKRQVKDEL